IVNDANAAICEAQMNGPALFSMTWIGRRESMNLRRRAVREEQCEIDEVADIAKQDATALGRILIPTVGWRRGGANRTAPLPRADVLEVGECAYAEGAETAIVPDP